jgi:hypothetical protein
MAAGGARIREQHGIAAPRDRGYNASCMLRAHAGLRLALLLVLTGQGCRDEPAPRGPDGPAFRDTTPYCTKLRRCLQQKLPVAFAPRLLALVHSQAHGCLGNAPNAAWAARDCLPYEFARDTASGLSVSLALSCSDGCPIHAAVAVEFSQPLGVLECLCVGAEPQDEPAFGAYERCVPGGSAPRAEQIVVAARDAPAATSEGQVPGYRVTAARALTEVLGLTSEVWAIDGVPAGSAAQLQERLRRLPREQPGSISLRQRGRTARTASDITLHYLPHETFRALQGVADEIGFERIGHNASPCSDAPGASGTLQLGEHSVRFQETCQNDVTLRLKRLAEAIRRAAAGAGPRTLAGQAERGACQRLRSVPILARLGDDRGTTIELRDVDWLAGPVP